MSRLETGLLIMALAFIGAARVLVVSGRYTRAALATIARLAARGARLALAWNRARQLARRDRKIEARVRALHEENRQVIVRFTNKPRFPRL